jgi:hypothetical protein
MVSMMFRLNLEFGFHGCMEQGQLGLNANSEQSLVILDFGETDSRH